MNRAFALVLMLAFSVSLFPTVYAADDGISSYNVTIPVVSPTPKPSATPFNTTDYSDPTPTPTPTPIVIDHSAIQSINPNGNSLKFSSYNSTVVSLLFASCVSCTVNVSSGGRWHDTRDSSGLITFYPEDIGTYNIHYQILYGEVVNQTVTLTIFGGDRSLQSLPIAVVNSGFTFDIELTVLELPHYPSASDIAAAQSEINRVMFEDYRSEMSGQVSLSQAVAVAGIAIGIVLAVIVYLIYRKQRYTDARNNAFNHRGLGARF